MTTDSAHRSSTPAHRSGGSGELKTEVFIVKTPAGMDAVIVSFVDDDEVSGIYLYEPGADPVELDSVGVEGEASEFEWATVTFTAPDPDTPGNVLLSAWPGDGMVTRAERDAAVESRAEGHENLQQAYDTLRKAAARAASAADQAHADAGHGGAFRWCTLPVCEAVRDLDGAL